MKKVITLLSALIIFFGITSFVSISPEQCSVSIKKGVIKIQGKVITTDFELSSFKEVLGEPDRTRDGYNKTHTYDKLGIVLFEKIIDKVPSGKVSEFQIHYSVPEANEVTPNGDGYKGAFKVEKMVVTKNLNAKKMLTSLKGWEKTDSYLEHSYRMQRESLYIYFQFNSDETELIKASIGISKKK